jgi:hypothetical protein
LWDRHNEMAVQFYLSIMPRVGKITTAAKD